MIAIPGYQITEQVYKSERSDIYRGYREEDHLPLFFKVLRDDHPSFSQLAQYRREYELTQSLQSDGVIKVYGLQKYQHNLVILVEDFGGESLEHILQTRAFSLNEFLTLAIQITRGLGDIHEKNIVHKDINPSNIVWNAATEQLKIIDFGAAMMLARENPVIKDLGGLEGTLSYISPEQTGRMNRSIDYRTDYYSLGVTFYELLTGELPFKFSDVAEMVHAHIADLPVSPSVVNQAVPAVVSDIVMKLMSKTAEKRYQSAQSLRADLEECARRLKETAAIAPFPLAQHDISDRFQIPETLYGRQDEITHLLTIFGHVAAGNTAVVLYTGEPGIGKSALVKEIYKPIVEKRGYFIAGKYDLLKRNIPYTAIIQAFEQLIQQILTESEARLSDWKTAILQGIGTNGQILIDLFPALELIIGPQPAVPSLPATESQNRFQYVFQNFVRVISPRAHALVLFIDDLQWADSASLNLLKLLTIDANNPYFLLIGAYRDNEVDDMHPLMLTIAQIKQAYVTVTTIHLNNLSFADVHDLIIDTLHCERTESRPLATLVYEKTSGNAFFVTQFLKSLHHDGLLIFDVQRRAWEWDPRLIRARSATDNVVELISQKIRRFPDATQEVLSLAACIGNIFDLGTLALISKGTPAETFPYLWSAIIEDLVVPLDDTYRLISAMEDEQAGQYSLFKFLHDRVQQAAYALIPIDQRKKVHLEIGRLLLSAYRGDVGEDLFDLLNHLNQGIDLITNIEERLHLANLNLRAGEKAKLSTAYETALRYLSRGMDLLADESWDTAYELTFALYMARAECAYLVGSFDVAGHMFDMLLTRARTPLEAAKILNLMVILNTSRGNVVQTLQSGTRGLSALDFLLPQTINEKKMEVGQELGAIQSSLAGMNIEDLLNLPTLADPERITILELCLNMIPMAIMSGDLDLYALLALKMVNMSLKHGSTGASSHAFIIYAAILVNALKDYKTAYRFGKLGLALGEKYNNAAIEAKNNMVFACWINIWSQHLETGLSHLMTTYQKGLEAGDLFFASSGFFNYVVVKMHLGRDLGDAYRDAGNALAFALKSKDEITTSILMFYRQLILNLRGETGHKLTLDDDSFDMEASLQSIREANNWIQLSHCLQCKFEILYLYGDIPAAIKTARELETVIVSLAGTMLQPRFQFLHALSLSAHYGVMTDKEKPLALEKLSDYQQQAKLWAEQCPENYAFMEALISAEVAHIQGDDLRAMSFYDEAIQAAQKYDYLQYEAMANELAAKFYLIRGQVRIAALYMREAHYVYGVWGAARKVRDLEDLYPRWFGKPTESRTTHSTPTASTQSLAGASLDLAAILKASQAIASEINFDRLIARLVHIAVENVGAQTGHLILDREGRLFVEAFGAVDEQDNALKAALPLEQAENLSVAIVRYVARTKESLILDDASQDSRFGGDPYIQARQPKSVLCTPIVHSGKLIGVLYLENNLVPAAFTTNQLEVLNMLNTQMAASIENAQLYRNLEAQSHIIKATNISLQSEVAERKKAEEKYRSIFENSVEGIFQTTQSGQFILANPACARILGYDSPQELIESITSIGQQLYVDSLQRDQLIQRLSQGNDIPGYETRLYRRDGSIIWASIHAQPVYDANGEVMLFEGLLKDITERVQAQDALRQEEERFRYAAMATRDGIYDSDIRADITHRNEAYQALYSPSEPTDPSTAWWEEHIHPDDRQRVMQSLVNAFKDRKPTWLAEYRFRRADDSYAAIVDHGYILYDQTGDPVRMIGAVSDITQHKMLEQALEEERNLLRTLIDNLPHYIYYKDTDAKIVINNMTSIRKFGGLPAPKSSDQAEMDIYDIAAARRHADDMRVLTTGEPMIDREETAIDSNSILVWLLTSKIPIYDKDRQITGLVGISIDITERKQTEQALRDSEESMRQLADGAFEGIEIHEKGIILEVNQAFCRMYGYDRAELIGKSMLDLTAPESQELVQQKIAANDPNPYEAVMLRKDGTTFRVEAEGRAITYLGRSARIATLHDLTERELAESRRSELALVNQKTSILKEFLNVVSHDLKTPLSIISISLYLLDRITDPKGQKAKLEQIKTQVRRLEKLIQDILTVSRLDAVPETIFQALDLNRALTDIHEQFETVAEEKQIRFTLDLAPALPRVRASDLELYRALTNLIENALHYTPPQGTVTIRTFSEEVNVVLEVRDTGIGISEADLQHVFEHFYRADKARATDTGGTGLGLAIVKKIMDIHSGTIEIESTLGRGSTFRVRLPQHQEVK